MSKFIVKMLNQIDEMYAMREVDTEEEIPAAIHEIVDEVKIWAPGDSIRIEELEL